MTLEEFARNMDAYTVSMTRKQLTGAVRSSLVSEARKGEEILKGSLSATGFPHASEMAMGIKGNVDRDKDTWGYTGYRVSWMPRRGGTRMHLTRRGKLKPIMLWLETGAVDRKTKVGGKNRGTFEKHEFVAPVRARIIGESRARIVATWEKMIYKRAKKHFGW